MTDSFLKILRRYQYDPLDRLTGAGLLAGDSTQLFYQENHLITELGQQTQRTILRHEAQPLAQQQSTAGVAETTLLATDQAHSLLHSLAQTNARPWAYTAYGHHPVERGLSRLLGFNGNCPDAMTGHYQLGQGTRTFNPILMRFNSPDRFSPFGEGGLNAYAYCEGDPTNFNDPTGTVRHHYIRNRAIKEKNQLAHPSSKTISKSSTRSRHELKHSPTLARRPKSSIANRPKSVPSTLKTEGYTPETHELMKRIDAKLPREPNLDRLENFGKRYDSSQSSNDPMKFSPTPEQINNLNHHYANRSAHKKNTPNGKFQDLNEALQILLAKKTSVKNHQPDINRAIRQPE